MLLRSFLGAAVLLLPHHAIGQAELIAPAAAAVLEQQLNSDLDARIRQAEAAADYATLNLLMRIKSLLEALRENGDSLIDHASAAANQQSYQTYLQIRAAINAPGDSIDQLQAAAMQAQQVAENLPTAGKRTYIINYHPRVSAPLLRPELRLSVKGVNLDNARLLAQLNGRKLKVQSLGMQEMVIVVPSNLLAAKPNSMAFNNIEVSHLAKTSFWSNLFGAERIQRTLPVVILPETAATVHVDGTTQVTQREYREFKAAVSLRGYSEQRRIQLPGEGWKFDLDKPFGTTQGKGEAGTCYGVDAPASTKEGIVVKANNSKYGPFKNKDGYVTCHLTAQIYREKTVPAPFRMQPFLLGWTAPVYIGLPHERSSFVARVKLFDGTEEPVEGASVHRYFESSLVGDQLLIKPIVPRLAD